MGRGKEFGRMLVARVGGEGALSRGMMDLTYL